MVRLLGASLAAVLLCAATPAPAASNDAQIRKMTDDFAAAWNKHDATALAHFWTADGDLINPWGRKAKGFTEIQQLLQDEQNGPLKGSTYSTATMSIRMLAPTLALADLDSEIANIPNPDGSTATFATFKHHVVFVLRKTNGKWWIVSARPYAFAPSPR
jgi:uncharacterized protein (TIGR02246 family)